VASLAPLVALSWLVSFWPAVLVLLGLWLLLRDRLPVAARRPISTFGGLGLLAYCILAAASGVAAGGAPTTSFTPTFGSPPFTDTVTLDTPIADGKTLNVNNSNGRTVIRAAAAQSVHVVATRHFGMAGQPPDVRLNPTGNGAELIVPDQSRR